MIASASNRWHVRLIFGILGAQVGDSADAAVLVVRGGVNSYIDAADRFDVFAKLVHHQ